jgi:FtsZ-binding cell division protein ZapB
MWYLYIILSLSIAGLLLTIRLKSDTTPLELILSLQRRLDKLEAEPQFYSQTVNSLNTRTEYLQRKNDDLNYEVRVVQNDRNALLAKNKILEEQNKALMESLKALSESR